MAASEFNKRLKDVRSLFLSPFPSSCFCFAPIRPFHLSIRPAIYLACLRARGHFAPAAADPEVREELYTSFFVSRRIILFCFLLAKAFWGYSRKTGQRLVLRNNSSGWKKKKCDAACCQIKKEKKNYHSKTPRTQQSQDN